MEVFLCESLVRSSLNSDLQPLWVVRLDKEGASCLCLGRLSDPEVWIGFQHFIFFTLNISLKYDTSVSFLGMYPKEMKTYIHIKICTWIFITALFVTPQIFIHRKMDKQTL